MKTLCFPGAAPSRVAALAVLAGTIACGGGSGGIGCSVGFGSESALAIALDQSDGKAAIVVSGVPPTDLATLRRADMTREQWVEVLRVSIGQGQPAVVGTYDVDGDRVRFTPMFPLDPGRDYHVVFSSSGTRVESDGCPAGVDGGSFHRGLACLSLI